MVTKSSDPSTKEGKEALFKDEWFLSPYDKINFLSNTQLTYKPSDNLLSAFAKAEVRDLKNGLKAISIASSLKKPFDSLLCPNVLFERSFYCDLFTEMRRSTEGCALIGSSGTSKSTFQYWFLFKVIEAFEKGKILIFELHNLYAKYYLSSICHAGLLFPTNDYFGTNPPEVVIRQCDKFVFYYLMREKVVYRSDVNVLNLDYFSPDKAVYLYEPGYSLSPPTMTSLITYTTVSPDPTRYKEFTKKSGVSKLYMPTYQLQELLEIGEYVKKYYEQLPRSELLLDQTAQFVLNNYNEDFIKSRYNKFGGIIRRVLIASETSRKTYDGEYAQAMNTVTSKEQSLDVHLDSVLSVDNLSNVDSYSVQWEPTCVNESVPDIEEEFVHKQYDFALRQTHLASENATNDILKSIAKLTFDQIRSILKKSKTELSLNPDLSKLFEKCVAQYCVKEHKYRLQEDWKCNKVDYSLTRFESMKDNVMYIPSVQSFPAVEMYFKKGNKLYAIQVSITKEDKVCYNGALAHFLDLIDYPTTDEAFKNINIIYFRAYRNSKWTICYKEYKKS
jgi:hypothetical protein